MYIVSPFIVRHMYKSKSPWILISVLCTLSTIVGYLILFLFLQAADLEEDAAELRYSYAYYAKPYCRFTPYLFGMLAAWYHRADERRDWQTNCNVLPEWIAFFTLIFIGFRGAWPWDV